MALVTFSCKNENKPEVKTVEVGTKTTKTVDPNAKYVKAEFTIEGMTCAMGCAKAIENKIAKLDGVKSSKVDFDKKLAMVEYDEAKVNPDLLNKTVAKVSDTYKVSNMKVGNSSGTSCEANCKNYKESCANKTAAEKVACAGEGKKSCCAAKA